MIILISREHGSYESSQLRFILCLENNDDLSHFTFLPWLVEWMARETVSCYVVQGGSGWPENYSYQLGRLRMSPYIYGGSVAQSTDKRMVVQVF